MESTKSTSSETGGRGFYLPATLQLSEPGRVERAVAAVRRRGAALRAAIRARIPERSSAR